MNGEAVKVHRYRATASGPVDGPYRGAHFMDGEYYAIRKEDDTNVTAAGKFRIIRTKEPDLIVEKRLFASKICCKQNLVHDPIK